MIYLLILLAFTISALMSKSRFFSATTKILGIMIIDIWAEIVKANRIKRQNVLFLPLVTSQTIRIVDNRQNISNVTDELCHI